MANLIVERLVQMVIQMVKVVDTQVVDAINKSGNRLTN
jgi:hypothetical protein